MFHKALRFQNFLRVHCCFVASALIAALVGASPASAMDSFEYQVYDSEINASGNWSLETHLNSNLVGTSTAAYDGELNQDKLTHLTFELARGMTPYWELGTYFQSAYGQDGIIRYAGVKLRSKFVVPHKKDELLQLGVNFEISNVPKQFESDAWGSEIRPIIGYSLGAVTATFNPIFDIDLTSGSSAAPDFSPALKVVCATSLGFGLGLEYYAELGSLNKLTGIDRAEQYLFAAFDLIDGPIELNLGLGTGLTQASNSTIAKAIFGFTF